MGQLQSSECVDLSQLPPEVFEAILADTYTVARTDGREETGWKFEDESHSQMCGTPQWLRAHATNKATGSDGKAAWKFFMNNGFCCRYDDDDESQKKAHKCREHACGWRTCDVKAGRCTFWPTRLETPAQRQEWWEWLNKWVETLEYVEEPDSGVCTHLGPCTCATRS